MVETANKLTLANSLIRRSRTHSFINPCCGWISIESQAREVSSVDRKYRNDIALLEGLSIIGDGNNPARPLKCSDSKSGAVLKLI